jgi:hypothetical protein
VSSFNKGKIADFFDVLLKIIDEKEPNAPPVFIVDENCTREV